MNKHLYWYNIKNNIKLYIVFILIMFMYKSVTINMFDPDNAEAMEAMLELIPEAMLKAMGYVAFDASLVGFLSGYFYGFIAIMFPMILSIMLSYKLIAKYVDNGSMNNLLSTPNSRQSIIITQIVSQLTLITDLFIALTLFGWLISAIAFPGHLDLGRYILLNIGTLLFFYALSAITFFISTLFNDGSKALTFAIGIPLIFFVINMLKSIDESLEFLRFFTIFTLFDTQAISEGQPVIWFQFLTLIVLAFIFYFLSVLVFKKKDLTL